jgi:GntR family transcriptional regulator
MVGDNGRLPSEAELSHRLQVSRATIREALAKLELGGVVIRRHGIGTYVIHSIAERPGTVWGWLDEAATFEDLIRSSGHRTKCVLFDTSVKLAGSLARPLRIDPQAKVLSIEKVFLSDSAPIIHSSNTVPYELIRDDRRASIGPGYQCSEPIYQFLELECGLKVHHQTSEVRAVPADEKLAQRLNCELGHPLLRVEEVGYSLEQQLLFYGFNHFRGDMVSFRQMRRPALNIGAADQ